MELFENLQRTKKGDRGQKFQKNETFFKKMEKANWL